MWIGYLHIFIIEWAIVLFLVHDLFSGWIPTHEKGNLGIF
jgi:hypothetical protein